MKEYEGNIIITADTPGFQGDAHGFETNVYSNLLALRASAIGRVALTAIHFQTARNLFILPRTGQGPDEPAPRPGDFIEGSVLPASIPDPHFDTFRNLGERGVVTLLSPRDFAGRSPRAVRGSFRRGPGVSSVVLRISPEVPRTSCGGYIAGIAPDELMLHELAHALRDLTGTSERRNYAGPYPNSEEFFAQVITAMYSASIPGRPIPWGYGGAFRDETVIEQRTGTILQPLPECSSSRAPTPAAPPPSPPSGPGMLTMRTGYHPVVQTSDMDRLARAFAGRYHNELLRIARLNAPIVRQIQHLSTALAPFNPFLYLQAAAQAAHR